VSLLWPGSSDIHLLGDGQRVVHLDAKLLDSALDFAMPYKELDRT
jgi:hypothetical protein